MRHSLAPSSREVGGKPKCDIQILYEPANERCTYEGASDSMDYLYVSSLENLQSKNHGLSVRWLDLTHLFLKG